MSGFELPIFPSETSALAVTTTVFVGVWVVALFNLSFGWTLSGLVVPGYLVPIMIAKPWAAAVIVGEAIVTYWLVQLVSERPRFLPCWCSFFGRDRFFALVLVSVFVRVIGDGWLLPWFGQFLDESLGITIDYRNDLHSYGLIIVSLIANYFWKPGLRRGLPPMMTTIAVSYLLTRYVLAELTNFNVGELQHTYEDISASLLASPKAYILIITIAYLASWMNLRYSWEFNGILIPALLGLLWHEPYKILVTVLEGLVVFAAGSALLKLPMWRRTTMEGGRKLLFFFSLCYCMRLTLAHLLPMLWPDIQVSDAFGFGYLLTTLMAIKAHDKQLTIRLVRGTIQVSLVGAIAGSVIGFMLVKLPSAIDLAGSRNPTESATVVQLSDRSLSELLRADKLLLYQMRARGNYKSPLHSEISAFQRMLELIKEFASNRNPETLEQISPLAARCNYEVLLVRDRFLYLHERSPARGWGIYVFDLNQSDGLCVEIPAPLHEAATIEAGVLIFNRFQAARLAVAGADRQTNGDGSSDVLVERRTIFSTFHRECGQHDVVQVRGHTRKGLRNIARIGDAGGPADLSSAPTQLWVPRSLPPSLSPRTLKELVPGFKLRWQAPPLKNVLREDSQAGFAELLLSHLDRQNLLAQLIAEENAGDDAKQLVKVTGHLSEWLSATKDAIAAQATEGYQVADVAEMLFFDQEVLTPLIHLLVQGDSPSVIDGKWTCSEETERELRTMNAAARAFDYELILFHDDHGKQAFVILSEPTPRRGWGTYAFRWYLAEPYLVEIPRPLLERHVFEFGISLFSRPPASVLAIAGAHPRANLDGSADLTRFANKVNLLSLTRQVLLREMASRPLLVVQARALQSPAKADVVIASDNGDASSEMSSPLARRLAEQLQQDGMSTAFVDGHPDTAGYEVSDLLRAAASGIGENKQVATLWLSRGVRMGVRDQNDNRALWAQFVACDIPTLHADLFGVLQSRIQDYKSFSHTDFRIGDDQAVLNDLLSYVADPDVVQLAALRQRWRDWHWTHLFDRRSGQGFLLLARRQHDLPLVVRVTGRLMIDERRQVRTDDLRPSVVDAFVGSNATILQLVEGAGG